MQEIHVDQRVVGWSAGRYVDHPHVGGKFHHGLLEKALNANALFSLLVRLMHFRPRGPES